MSSQLHPEYFPLTKGTFLFLGLLLFFATINLAIYLWYDLRLAEIEQPLYHLNP
ncbi:MAG: hypothetical protein K9J17_07700 [Flavobacteriales bacterium]|nr:hypothetical protein [Flavobacteriales bacterium]